MGYRGASRRQHNLEVGRRGEQLAETEYHARGYTTLARNWRAGRRGELDLVLLRSRLVVVCEVKSRTSLAFGLPAEAVDWRKQARLRALAAAFVEQHELRPSGIRFDVASVLGGTVDIIEGAF